MEDRSSLGKIADALLKHACLLVFVFCFTAAWSQSITMPSSGLQTHTLQANTTYHLLDPGGNNNYSNHCSGAVQLIAANGASIHITGSYNTETNYDKIYIYNGTYEGNDLMGTYSGNSSLNIYCNSGMAYVMFTSDGSVTRTGFNLTITICDSSSNWMQQVVSNVTDSGTVISWTDPQSSISQWTVRYGTNSSNLNHSVHTTVPQVTLTGLEEYTNYYYRIYRNNGNSSSPCYTRTYQFITPCNNDGSVCINHANLNPCHVSGHYGTVSNPDIYTGIINNGSSSNTSRHTIHTNLSEYDPRTGNQLKTVPPGFDASVRLGNWQTGALEESITYEYHVDTLKSDLLIMKYAAVLEDPNHDADEQPRFSFQILDSNNVEINHSCYSANFVSNVNLGWHSYGNTLWKDWTTVGIDLTPLHGQTIYIKLATFDCSLGGHYGYAYFVFDCTHKNLSSSNCGNVVENTFTAPDGFAYNWYRSDDPATTLSTAQSLHVTQAGDYICNMQFIGAPAGVSCSFDLHAYAGERYPMAAFSWTELDSTGCNVLLQLLNNSVICNDAAHQQPTAMPCESYQWFFDDGTSSTDPNPQHVFTPGLHTVTLVAELSNGTCSDTLQQQVFISSPCTIYDTVDASICEGESYTLFDTVLTTEGTYVRDSGYVHRTIHLAVSPTSASTIDTTLVENNLPLSAAGMEFNDTVSNYPVHLVNQYGCDSTVTVTLHIWRNVTATADSVLCENNAPLLWNGVTFVASKSQTVTLPGAEWHGADSILTMHVTILENTTLVRHDTVVENSLPISLAGLTFHDTQNDTIWIIPNAAGCDSIINYSLHVWHNVTAEADSTICENSLPLLWNGHSFSDTDTVTVNLATVGIHGFHGEDSTLTMRLHVLRNSQLVQNDTLVENALPVSLAGCTFHHAVADTSWIVPNAAGCDSLVSYSLHVWNNISAAADSALCRNSAPLVWNGVTFDSSGTFTVTLAAAERHGADSILTLHVTILENSALEWHDTVVENSLPVFVGGITFVDSHADTNWIISNAAGCDSSITYSLHVWHNVTAEADSTICENSLPLLWNGHSFADADTVSVNLATVSIRARHGEDSTLTMRLHVLRNSQYTQSDTVVENSLPVSLAGCTFHHAVTDTAWVIPNAVGCDSVIHYSLHVWNNYHHAFDSTICDNMLPLLWCDTLFLSQGSKQLFYQSVHGADSIVDLSLTVHPTYEVYDTAVICHGDTGVYGVTTAGNQDIALLTHYGCDSLLHLTVIVKPVYHFHFYDTICDNQHIMFDSHEVNTPGHQEVLHQTIDGCDSLLKLDLVVRPTSRAYTHAVVCDGVPYTWENGVTYYQSTYEPTLTYTNSVGCDSLLRLILDLDSGFHAEMKITPEMVSYTNPEVRLSDVSPSRHRVWYYNDHTDSNRVVSFDYPLDKDSIPVLMVAYSQIGCIDSAWGVIHVDRGILWAPNVFTPDEPTNNRFFIPSNELQSGEIWIYDRKGLFITHFDALTGSWDGTYQGRPCPQDTYVWVMRYTTKAKPRNTQQAKGTVTLLR